MAPLPLLQMWLDCRCLGLEWQGVPPAACMVWAGLLQGVRRDSDGALRLTLAGRGECRVAAVGETDCYAWEGLLRHCEAGIAASSRLPLRIRPRQRALCRPALDDRGGLAWQQTLPRCAATRRWLAGN